ncbi:VOC family protein [Litorihabitans aurantiacus]|uniref:Glyoxalase n=1 Tax=Litorihabitans aurantiacus TaxID=1930061 RepID=A0AA38CSR6_9MICO|nr:VOC family protein [Litorihabitans aurantiacus]GMA33684.1 glyoxalase [Litorihabitans aurantiacus]GMA33695.1 glyoxalase [Litorihabitans aurantiacus]GMA33758.1 glyoxalase [Litorihabitans aurantiacus]
MNISSVTVGLPVADLAAAVLWYRRVLELIEPGLEPDDDVVEFKVGPVWLQLGSEPTARSGAEVVLRLGVTNAALEHERLMSLGVAVGPLQHVESAVNYFDFVDPDGNRLSIYSLVPAGA